MHTHPYASATFALVTSWAVGLAATVAIADTETGLIRDHPLFGRRLSGWVVPPLAAAGAVVPFLVNGHGDSLPPHWVVLSIPLMLPFAWLSWPWSRSWIRRSHALVRRRQGYWAVGAGVAGLVVSAHLSLGAFEPPWRPVIPVIIFICTAALLGSLTNFALLALTAGLPAEVPGGPAANLSHITGFGLAGTSLAGIELGLAWVGNPGAWPPAAVALGLLWMAAAIGVPGLLLLLRLFLRRLPDAAIMPAALVSAAVGQWVGFVLLFLYPGLAPLETWTQDWS